MFEPCDAKTIDISIFHQSLHFDFARQIISQDDNMRWRLTACGASFYFYNPDLISPFVFVTVEAILPFTSIFITVAIGSNASAGTVITVPSAVLLVFNLAPVVKNLAEVILLLNPGTSSFPSLGQSKTEI